VVHFVHGHQVCIVIVLTGSDDPLPALKSIEEGRRNPAAWIYVVEVAIPQLFMAQVNLM
jgi:hypothetical protein